MSEIFRREGNSLTMAQIQDSTRRYTFKEWQKIIKRWKKSGLSIKSYCKKKKLKYGTFRYWKKRLESPKPANFRQRTTYPREQWKEIIEDWQGSGYSQLAYCMQKKLSPSTFHNWYKKIVRPSLASQEPADLAQELGLPSLKDLFVPLTVTPSEVSLDSSLPTQKMEVVFAQGHRLSLEGPFDWEELNTWLTPLLTKRDEE